jgi:hypothetical protein
MFQFRNIKTNKTYTLNEIDEIVCKFWNVPVDKHEYARPIIEGQKGMNWFDVIGHAIEDLQYYQTKNSDGSIYYYKACGMDEMHSPMFKFNDIAPQLISSCVYAETLSSLEVGLAIYKPYYELCYHLMSLDIVGVAMGW